MFRSDGGNEWRATRSQIYEEDGVIDRREVRGGRSVFVWPRSAIAEQTTNAGMVVKKVQTGDCR